MIPVIRLVFHCCHLQNDRSIASTRAKLKSRVRVANIFSGEPRSTIPGHSAFVGNRIIYFIKEGGREVISLKPRKRKEFQRN